MTAIINELGISVFQQLFILSVKGKPFSAKADKIDQVMILVLDKK